MAMGPAAPMITDQKSAGRSRAAQRQYLRGVDQKTGADMMACIQGRDVRSVRSFRNRTEGGTHSMY